MPETQHASHSNQRASSCEARPFATSSAEFLKLQSVFHSLPKPYGLDGAVRFNLLFSHLYPQLSRHEKIRAEEFIDTLYENLDDKHLAHRTSGVV